MAGESSGVSAASIAFFTTGDDLISLDANVNTLTLYSVGDSDSVLFDSRYTYPIKVHIIGKCQSTSYFQKMITDSVNVYVM